MSARLCSARSAARRRKDAETARRKAPRGPVARVTDGLVAPIGAPSPSLFEGRVKLESSGAIARRENDGGWLNETRTMWQLERYDSNGVCLMSYPNITTPAPSARELARRADNDAYQHIQRRAREVQLKVVDAFDRIMDQLAQEDAAAALSRADERRQFANMVCAHEVCARRACRRKHACLGEPRDCLRVVIPVLGIERFAPLIERQRTRRKTRGAR